MTTTVQTDLQQLEALYRRMVLIRCFEDAVLTSVDEIAHVARTLLEERAVV